MKVLFPLDGTDLALRALEKGLSLLHGAGNLRATAYYVRERDGEGLFEAAARELTGAEPKILSAEESIARAKEIADALGMSLEAKRAEGAPYETLLKEAGAYDLLVVHALTKPSMKDLFTGSAIEKFVRNAPVSVLVVRD